MVAVKTLYKSCEFRCYESKLWRLSRQKFPKLEMNFNELKFACFLELKEAWGAD